MFCPKCGKADQAPETYCRQCGGFLPDFEKALKKPTPPEEHLKANAVLSFLTGFASLILSILLFLVFKNYPDPHPIIYVTAGFLLTVTAWQIQTFWRTMLLRKHFKKSKPPLAASAEKRTFPDAFEPQPTDRFLPAAGFDNHVPASVVERTTRKLKVKSGK
ncbi:MAG TPA: hypothetical protein VIL74_20215 [Pyrinomonadaceae bacterium]|jgi:hypothetical protein